MTRRAKPAPAGELRERPPVVWPFPTYKGEPFKPAKRKPRPRVPDGPPAPF